MRKLLFILSLLSGTSAGAQSLKIFGKVTNAQREPLAFVSIQIKDHTLGVMTKEDGSYELLVEEGKYDLLVSMIGYRSQVLGIAVKGKDYEQNIIMEVDDAGTLSEVKVRSRDKAEEYVRNVIRNKEAMVSAAGAYSCQVYIKAIQEDSMALKKPKKTVLDDSMLRIMQANAALDRMAMAEIVLKLDHESSKRIREERIGITKRGKTQSLFFLSTAEADFNFYNNLVSIPGISPTPFLSPLSYSGLLAYRFKTIKTEMIDGRKVFTIAVKPRQLSNATVEGEIKVVEGLWVLLHTKLRLPKYHLTEYDFFEIEQRYELINNTAWMITRQELTYQAVSDRKKSSGRTTVSYKEFELNRKFERSHFGDELSTASAQAYERDSSFWEQSRTEPLTPKEVRFIQRKDSIFRATHTKAYLDSLDRETNRIRWQNIAFNGQTFNDHEKERRWYIPALPSFYNPFTFGGSRVGVSVMYIKGFKSKQHLNLFADVDYGFRNKDVNGATRFNHLYDPVRRSYYSLRLERDFEYIFNGDAWINMIKRSNIFLNQVLGVAHGQELANGLFLNTDIDMAFRRSVSDYKTNDRVDSLFGDVLDDNYAVDFPSYNAFYGKFRLSYTPRQRYIREPREKIILGSSWPTFYVEWRKGIPGILNSKVDFDYLELGMKQSIRMGIIGLSSYTISSGTFLSKKDLRLVDYKFQRRGDPFLFMNPNEAFQSLDSTFPVFKRFYEGHYVHEFNGAILNKIPFFKKIGLREIAGAGFLVAPERDLRYAELFGGIEKVFKYPFNQLGKFKLGVYVVGSVANQFRNPVQFKIGITTWDRKRGKWL